MEEHTCEFLLCLFRNISAVKGVFFAQCNAEDLERPVLEDAVEVIGKTIP